MKFGGRDEIGRVDRMVDDIGALAATMGYSNGPNVDVDLECLLCEVLDEDVYLWRDTLNKLTPRRSKIFDCRGRLFPTATLVNQVESSSINPDFPEKGIFVYTSTSFWGYFCKKKNSCEYGTV
jgi:hypothetical protein